MKFHALAYEALSEDEQQLSRVEFRLYKAHKDLTAARHTLRHRNVRDIKTLPMVGIPPTKAGLMYVNHITAFAAAHTDVDWFVSNFKAESERLLGEGCVDES